MWARRGGGPGRPASAPPRGRRPRLLVCSTALINVARMLVEQGAPGELIACANALVEMEEYGARGPLSS